MPKCRACGACVGLPGWAVLAVLQPCPGDRLVRKRVHRVRLEPVALQRLRQSAQPNAGPDPAGITAVPRLPVSGMSTVRVGAGSR